MPHSPLSSLLPLALAALAVVQAPRAEAAPVKMSITGTASNSASTGVISAGDSVRYTFIYDSALAGPDGDASATAGRFSPVLYSEVSINGGALLFNAGGGAVNQSQFTVAAGVNAQWNLTGQLDTTDLPSPLLSVNFLLSYADFNNDPDAPFADPNVYTDIRALHDRLDIFSSMSGILNLGNRGRPGDNIAVALDFSSLRFEDLQEPTTPLPLPGTLALAVAGLAALRACRRPGLAR